MHVQNKKYGNFVCEADPTLNQNLVSISASRALPLSVVCCFAKITATCGVVHSPRTDGQEGQNTTQFDQPINSRQKYRFACNIFLSNFALFKTLFSHIMSMVNLIHISGNIGIYSFTGFCYRNHGNSVV